MRCVCVSVRVCSHLVEGGVCEHVVVAEAGRDDGEGRGDGGDGGGRTVRQQDVSLRTVQGNLFCGLYDTHTHSF